MRGATARDSSNEGVLGEDPYSYLQEMEVLAVARQRVLGGSTIDLTPEEAARAKETNRLPPEVEERVGEDESRNAAILEAILELPSEWKTIVFAASVSHAEQLAATPESPGIRAAVISAKTNPAARRHYVREFNRGLCEVLTNYGVLAEGFDAPSVRAVIVARPTLSPNVVSADDRPRPARTTQRRQGGVPRSSTSRTTSCASAGELAFRHFDYLFDRS